MSNAQQRSNRLRLAATDAILEWMEEEDLRVGDIAGELGTTLNRALAAAMGADWNPTLEEIARIEAALEVDLIKIPRSEDT